MLKKIEIFSVILGMGLIIFGLLLTGNNFNNKELLEKDSIINFYKKTIESDLRLKQHFYAVLYKDSLATDKNIIEFLKLSNFKNIDEAYITARLETANGKTGVGKPPINNHFGMKKASTRFSWAEGVVDAGYVKYKSWPYSYLDFYEYTEKGYKNWQKTAKQRKIIIKDNKYIVK